VVIIQPARNHRDGGWLLPGRLSLLQRGARRALPLADKSQRPEAAAAADSGADGHSLALELLLTG
jgi:hypothetical protein